jgi:hypothetical protein
MNKNQEDREFGNLRKLPLAGSIVIFGRLTLTETPRIHSTFVLSSFRQAPRPGLFCGAARRPLTLLVNPWSGRRDYKVSGI